MEINRLEVALVRLGSRRREDLVMLAPRHEYRRLIPAEVFLPTRVEGRVAPVAQEQVKLDLVIAATVEQELIVCGSIGADQRRVLDTVCVLPLRRVVRQERTERIPFLPVRRLLPVCLERLPEVIVDRSEEH